MSLMFMHLRPSRYVSASNLMCPSFTSCLRRIIRAFLLEEQKIVKKVIKQQKAQKAKQAAADAAAAAASSKKKKSSSKSKGKKWICESLSAVNKSCLS